jgi:hypothetical protein
MFCSIAVAFASKKSALHQNVVAAVSCEFIIRQVEIRQAGMRRHGLDHQPHALIAQAAAC